MGSSGRTEEVGFDGESLLRAVALTATVNQDGVEAPVLGTGALFGQPTDQTHRLAASAAVTSSSGTAAAATAAGDITVKSPVAGSSGAAPPTNGVSEFKVPGSAATSASRSASAAGAAGGPQEGVERGQAQGKGEGGAALEDKKRQGATALDDKKGEGGAALDDKELEETVSRRRRMRASGMGGELGGFSQMSWMRVPPPDSARQRGCGGVTMSEVRKHRKADDAWTVVRGKVYDITPYLKFHPGGVETIMKGAGRDATFLFNKYHAWVNIDFLLEKCFIGVLVQE